MATEKKSKQPQVLTFEDSLSALNKKHGEGSVIRLGDEPKMTYSVIPTGSINLDRALGVGGLPLGRLVDLFGSPSCGKSSLSLHIIGEAQKLGYKCAWLDYEFSFDPVWADALGVDTDNLFFSQPPDCETGCEIISDLVKSAQIKLIVVDSAAAMLPRSESESDFGSAPMAIQARLLSQFCRKMVGPIAENGVLVIFINQTRAANFGGYGPSTTQSGGNALKFYSSIRLEVARIAQIKKGDEIVGARTRVKVVKNKCGRPFTEAEFDFLLDCGIDKKSELIDLAVEKSLITKAGSWFSYGAERLGQGKDSAKEFLAANPDICAEITKKILSQ